MSEQAGSSAWREKNAPELKTKELEDFCALIGDLAGIAMSRSKYELIQARLRPRLAAHGLRDYAEYRELLDGLPRNDPEWQVFINLLTTNKTDFFREPAHFAHLVEQILPAWAKGTESTMNIWSCASSTGEEPYTLAMVMHRHLPPGRDFRILATDIDTSVLQTAANAVYPVAKLPEIPAEYRHASVDIGTGNVKGWFRMKPSIRNKVSYRQHNLIQPAGPGEQGFDLVLCRNVLIYFSRETIELVNRKLYTATRPGGSFMIGHSESLQGIAHDWKSTGPSIYRKAA